MATGDDKPASDMSIDELSAAIDAHMQGISSASIKKKAKAPSSEAAKSSKDDEKDEKVKSEDKSSPTTKPANKEVAVDEPVGQKTTKIKTRNNTYLSKSEDENQENSPSEPKSDKSIPVGTRKIKPISSSETDSNDKKVQASPAKQTTKPPRQIVDVMVAKKPVVEATRAAPNTTEVISAEDEPAASDEGENETTAESPEPTEATSPSVKKEDNVETEKNVNQESNTKEPSDSPAQTDNVPEQKTAPDDLEAQIVTKRPKQDDADSNELKVFDTKQYHIPIKPSRHHQVSNTFMVFIVLLVATLATIYVLSELQIIDLAALVYPK